MAATKITILRASPYVTPSSQVPAMAGQTAVTFEELKRWVNNGTVLKHFFRYEESVLWAYDLRLIPKPFWTAVLIRLLARRRSLMTDRLGAEVPITLGLLGRFLRNLVRDALRRGPFLKSIGGEMGRMKKEEDPDRPPLVLSRPPIYLRTDLVFGLQSGGSVGHIAGVLNQLDQFAGKPVFLTTDDIPTVRGDLEVRRILPGDSFWDFREMQPICFNEDFYQKALEALGERKISFVYQRYSLNNFSGLKLARKFRVPFVLEYNGSEIWINRNWGTPLRYEALAEENEMLNLQGCDVIVVVSRPMADELAARGVDPGKILVNPNGVDPETYSPKADGSGVRKKHGLEGKAVIGFIGTFGRWHGAEVLAEAFGRLLEKFPGQRDKARLLMIGDGATMPLVKAALAKHGLSDLCVLTGAIPQAQGPAHLAACDILAAPHVPNPDGTPFFGSPTKLFEYMAMGKAIVASDLDQIGEVLKHDGTAWMVKPGDPESLALGLQRLLEDASLRTRLGESARKEAVAHYSWKEHTRKIIEKLKERCP